MSLYPNATHVSRNLAWSELACRDQQRTEYPRAWRASRAVPLAEEFERIRKVINAPIPIGSAYRTEAHNRAVGGAKASQHVEGRALDLYPPTGWSIDQFYDVIHAIAIDERSGLWGVGRYGVFIHIDIRPVPEHGRLIVWRGSRAWAEVKTAS